MHRIQRDIPAVSFYKYHPTTGQHTTPGDTKKMEKKAMCTVCYIFRIALLVLLFLRVVGERGGVSSSPRPDTSIASPAISCVSHPHLCLLSLPIILWYHAVTPYYDTTRVPNYFRLQLFR